METQARYVQIGLFTLGAIFAGFAFVYWLYSGGSIGSRNTFRVAFTAPVPGVQVGSTVLFNGVRVGEVTGLVLPMDKPSQVIATIAVDKSAPVRGDTRVTIAFEGLTGSPAVQLIGGEGAAPQLAAMSGLPPLLQAEPDAGRNLTESATDTLRRVNSILDENREPLRNAIADISKFTEVLGRNTDRIDAIMSGLSRLAGAGSTGRSVAYDLTAVDPSVDLAGRLPIGLRVLVPEPVTMLVLNGDRIQQRGHNGGFGPLDATAQWTDNLPVLVLARFIESFERAGYLGIIDRRRDELEPTPQLQMEIRAFQIEQNETPTARVEIVARIATQDGALLAVRKFDAKKAIPSSAPEDRVTEAAVALDQAFTQVQKLVVPWTIHALAEADLAPPTEPALDTTQN